MTRSIAVSVEWCFLYADWCLGIRPWSLRCSFSGLLDDLGHEREVRHWPEIGHVGCVEPRLFEQRRDERMLLSIRQSSSLSSFRECSMTEVRRIIMSSPIKSCTLDPVPYITRMVLFTATRTTAGFSEACARHASAQKAGAQHIQHGQFPASIEPLVHFQGHREGRLSAAE